MDIYIHTTSYSGNSYRTCYSGLAPRLSSSFEVIKCKKKKLFFYYRSVDYN